MAMDMESFDVCKWISHSSGVDAATTTLYPGYSPVLDDHIPDVQLDPENEQDRFIMQGMGMVVDQWPTHSFQTTKAMDFDSILYNCPPQPLPTHHTVASPDLSSGTCAQLPPACLPATSPLPSAPQQLEFPLINDATAVLPGLPSNLPASALRTPNLCKSVQLPPVKPPPRTAHVDALALLPCAAQRLRKLPQSLQQALPAAAHARPAKARGRPGGRGRAAAERSASRGRSRSRSPIRSANITISDVSGDESNSGKELLSNTTVEDDKKPPLKYRGISFHKENRAWRTTVFYKSKFALHVGYEREALKAARKYDELCLYLWPDRKDKLNFPKDKYPARKDLEAKWLPVLEAKAAAAEENLRQKAEEAAKHERERAQAKLKAAGGIRKKTASKKTAKKGQNKRKKKSSSSSESEFTISDATLESYLDDDGDGEGEIISTRSPPSVATRAPRPQRRAAQEAQKNWNALMGDLTDCEKESEEDPHQLRNKMPGAQSSAVLQPAMGALPLAGFGLQMEMMDEDAIEDQLLTDLASDPLAQSILLAS
ncbi:hypothetical protein COCOBI_03-0690 [Coccomyxa sp. Obi]|nr:hypothetical protein COCOBI_03-0690 [Coccomyxa sp. Obi]